MRTIPTAISDGFSNDLIPFWLVALETSGATYYWPTTKRDDRYTPVWVAASQSSTSGGTLTVGTKYYVVTAIVGGVEQAQSAQASAVTVPNGKITITWKSVVGATGYRVYGRASGAQNMYWAVSDPIYVDDGTAGTAGSPPGTDVLILKATSGGSALNYDSTMIALEVDGGAVDGIGQAESSVDIYEGGGVARVGDVLISILNQERFDQDIVSAGIHIENRPLTIYFGFIPAGPSPTVVIDDDMLQRWTGVCEDYNDYDNKTFALHCVDGSFQHHKNIPPTLVTLTDYPHAPKEAIGIPIPLLYGDFIPANATDEIFAETLSPVPTVKCDDIVQTFLICDHEIHTGGSAYTPSGGNNLFGWLTDRSLVEPTFYNTSVTYLDFYGLTSIMAQFIQTLKMAGANSVGVTDYSAAVDSDLTNIVTMTASQIMSLQPIERQQIGTGIVGGGLRIRFGTITGTGSYGYWDGSSYHSIATFWAALSNSDQDFGFGFSPTFDNMATWEFQIRTDAASTAEIKVFALMNYIAMGSIFYPTRMIVSRGGPANGSGSGTRGVR